MVTTAMALSEHASVDERRWFTNRYAVERWCSAAGEMCRGPPKWVVKDDEMARRQWKSWGAGS